MIFVNNLVTYFKGGFDGICCLLDVEVKRSQTQPRTFIWKLGTDFSWHGKPWEGQIWGQRNAQPGLDRPILVTWRSWCVKKPQ